MKKLYKLFKPITLIALLTLGYGVSAQQVSNGPVQLQIRADAFWKGNYDDVIDNTEERNKIWFQDNANLDGNGWVGGNCFQWAGASGSGGFPMWSPPFNTVIFSQNYGANVPQFFNIQLDAWEEDSGGDCDFDGPCSICFDPDDNRCGPTQIGGNIDFRTQGPPCVWNQTEIVPGGGGNCANYGVRVSSKYTPPVPTITGPTTGCGSVTLTGNGAVYGGSYNWYSAPTGGTLLFSGSQYTINTVGTTTVYLQADNSCSSLARSSYTVTVSATTDATFNYSAATYCKNANDPSPAITTPGGSFAVSPSSGLAINSSNGTIDVSASTAGTYTITYTAPGACPGTQTRTVTIIDADDATFSYSAPSYCQTTGIVTPTIAQNGGNFNASPAGLAITPSNGVIDLGASQAGTYTVTYQTTGTCPATSTQQVVITPGQTATFAYTSNIYCQDDPNQPTPNVTGTPGGAFSVTGSGLVLNNITGAIDLQNSTPGTYLVRYDSPGPCAAFQTTNITIVDNPTAPTATSPAPICDGTAIPQLSASGLGGTINWYDAAVGGTLLQANSSIYNPSISGPGTYVYYAEEVGQSSCASTRTPVTITVNPVPAAPVVSQPNPICIGDAAPTLSANGNNVLFNWYDAVVGGSLLQGNSSNYVPTINTPGTYTYYVEAVAPGNCASLTRTPITLVVNQLPLVAIATNDNTLCANETPVPVFGFPQGVGGQLSGSGVSGSVFDPEGLSGSVTVTYTYTDGNGCVNSANQQFIVYDVPQPVIVSDGATVLCSGGSVNLDAGAGYQSYDWSNDETTQTINVTESGVFTVTVTSFDGCIGSSSTPITVALVPDTFVAAPILGNVATFCQGSPINTTLDAGAGWSVYEWSTTEFSQTINVTSAGDYWVRVTNALGCQYVDTVSVGYSTVSANIIADGPLLFCLGDSVQLSVNQAYSYLWTSGSTTQAIEVTQSGWYGITVEDIFGCQATDSVEVTVEFPPVADFNFAQESNSLDMNFFDFSMNGVSYSWDFGDNSSGSSDQNPVHSFPNPGEYNVTLTVTNSCGEDEITLVVPVKIVSVPEMAIDHLSIYPNPTDGNLQVNFNSSISQAIDIRVMNTVGQLLFADSVNNFSGPYQRTYDLSSLPSGVYLFQIVTELGSRTERVVVQK